MQPFTDQTGTHFPIARWKMRFTDNIVATACFKHGPFGGRRKIYFWREGASISLWFATIYSNGSNPEITYLEDYSGLDEDYLKKLRYILEISGCSPWYSIYKRRDSEKILDRPLVGVEGGSKALAEKICRVANERNGGTRVVREGPIVFSLENFRQIIVKEPWRESVLKNGQKVLTFPLMPGSNGVWTRGDQVIPPGDEALYVQWAIDEICLAVPPEDFHEMSEKRIDRGEQIEVTQEEIEIFKILGQYGPLWWSDFDDSLAWFTDRYSNT